MRIQTQGDAVRLGDDASLNNLVRALECLGDAVAVADPKDKISFVNNEFEKLLGYAKSELVGNHVSVIVPPSGFDVTNQMVLAAENEKWQGEVLRLHKTGKPIPVNLTATLVRGDDGEVAGRVMVMRNAAEEKQEAAERHALAKMEAIEQLAGGIAHNFNNLLTPILGYAQLGERALPENNHVRSYLGEIHRAALRSATLTRHLLTFSRRQAIKPEVVDLNELLSGMEGSLKEAVGERVKLIVKPCDGVATTKVDVRQIEQVLTNLVSNARDAMENGGVLTIETSNVDSGSTAEQYVTLSVEDTGVGMSEQIRERIFEPFFTTKGLDKGIGLGLSMCYGIVTQSGGQIKVESEEGNGTTVKILLPRSDEYLGSTALDARKAMGG